MKLINNRFRVKEPIKYGRDSEAYIIKDLHDKEKLRSSPSTRVADIRNP